MVRSAIFAVAAGLLLAAVSVSASDVIVGNKENFADIIGKDDLTLVKFYAPWCGHCKKMAPDFEKAATELKGKAQLVDLDATVEKDLASKYGIRGFPTLKLFSKGELISDYKGGRTKDALVKYIERAMLPAFEECADADAVKKFTTDNEGKVLVFGVATDKLAAEFKKSAMSVRDALPDTIAFATVPDGDLIKELAGKTKTEADSVVIVRDDKTSVAFSDAPAELESWIKLSSLPAFAELSRDNAQTYTEADKPVFLYFQDPENKKEEEYKAVEEVAVGLRGKGVLFTWINAVELKSFAEHLGVADNSPAIAVYDFKSDMKYVFSDTFSKEALTAWVAGVTAGKVAPSMKSEPVPETNDEPVKVVVGDSWKDIVEDETKDVLIEQYAPWCGHCKKLEPLYTKLAEALAGVETLVIAKMDSTKNDAPADYKVKGFPTIHFFPAGSKTGIAYESERELKNFVEFLKEKATHKEGIDLPEEDAEEKEDKEEGDEKEEL